MYIKDCKTVKELASFIKDYYDGSEQIKDIHIIQHDGEDILRIVFSNDNCFMVTAFKEKDHLSYFLVILDKDGQILDKDTVTSQEIIMNIEKESETI